jgi:hypothetical protein
MTKTQTPDLTLSGSLLVVQFNEMVATATDLGLTAKEVNRFADTATGVKRTEALHKAIQERVTALKIANEEAAELAKHTGRPANTDTSTESVVEASTSEGNSAPEDQSEEATERLPDETEEAFMARKAAKKTSARGKTRTKTAGRALGGKRVKSTGGTTIREKTEQYNSLVPAAHKKGVTWAKRHTSNFESQEKADIALKKLQDAMKKA